MAANQSEYPIFKGLQKPLEFMGIRGRFLIYAAVSIGLSLLLFFVFSIIIGKLGGFIAMVISLGTGLALIYTRQKQGLHNKQIDKGIFFVHTIQDKG